MSDLHFVFDIESVGLYGKGFAAGIVVIDRDKKILEKRYLDCPVHAAEGRKEDFEWVLENVCPYLPPTIALPKDCIANHYSTPFFVRQAFWGQYVYWKDKGAKFWADCGYPVEAGFLRDCVADDPTNRTWEAPYPLHDIATLKLAKGLDPIAAYGLPKEQQHNPVCESEFIANELIDWLYGKSNPRSAPANPPATPKHLRDGGRLV